MSPQYVVTLVQNYSLFQRVASFTSLRATKGLNFLFFSALGCLMSENFSLVSIF
jgi:hypothetical protein